MKFSSLVDRITGDGADAWAIHYAARAAQDRGEDVIIAHHDTTVQPDDHLILFLTDRRHIEAVEKLFQGSASFL